MNNFEEKLFKIVIYGPSGCGKTLLLRRYSQGVFNHEYATTIGVDFMIKHVTREGKNYKLQLWDTAGQERFRCISQAYFRGSQGIILCYDISLESTFSSMITYFEELTKIMEQAKMAMPPIILCGLKLDLEESRQVSPDCAQAFAFSNNMAFIENSSKSNQNVEQTFEILMDLIIKTNCQQPNLLTDSQNLRNAQQQEMKKGCC